LPFESPMHGSPLVLACAVASYVVHRISSFLLVSSTSTGTTVCMARSTHGNRHSISEV
jgi:hypothetical protein